MCRAVLERTLGLVLAWAKCRANFQVGTLLELSVEKTHRLGPAQADCQVGDAWILCLKLLSSNKGHSSSEYPMKVFFNRKSSHTQHIICTEWVSYGSFKYPRNTMEKFYMSVFLILGHKVGLIKNFRESLFKKGNVGWRILKLLCRGEQKSKNPTPTPTCWSRSRSFFPPKNRSRLRSDSDFNFDSDSAL